MHFTEPNTISTAFFLLIVTFVLAAIITGVYYANQRLGNLAYKRTFLVTLGVLTWLVVTSTIVTGGFLEASPMPRVLLFFAAVNLAAVLFGLSPVGRWLATGIPLNALVLFQAFRIPLEIVLHSWARQGSIPWSMTWSGANLDIISGGVALAAAPFSNRFKSAAWIANLTGAALLVNVGRVVVLSSPLPFSWTVHPPLQLAFHLPYAWIATVCVAGALAGHVVLTRALFLRK